MTFMDSSGRQTTFQKPCKYMIKSSLIVGKRYELGSVCQDTAHGLLYLAVDRYTYRPCVCKRLIHSNLSLSLLSQLHLNISLTRTLKHPNLMEYWEIAEGNSIGSSFLIMKDMRTDGLKTHPRLRFGTKSCRGSTFSSPSKQTFWLVLMQLAELLAYLHSPSKANAPDIGTVILRSLDPSSIYLDSSGVVTVAQIRMSKYFETSNIDNQSANIARYLSPEVLMGKQPTWASDIWSLGCFMYEFYLGAPYIQGACLSEILHSISAPPSFNNNPLLSGKDTNIVSLLSRMLAPEPNQRIYAKHILKLNTVHDIWRTYRRVISHNESLHKSQHSRSTVMPKETHSDLLCVCGKLMGNCCTLNRELVCRFGLTSSERSKRLPTASPERGTSLVLTAPGTILVE